MNIQYFIPGWGFLNQTNNGDYFIQGWGYINDGIAPNSSNSSIFQPGTKAKHKAKVLTERYPDFEPVQTYEVEYLLLTL